MQLSKRNLIALSTVTVFGVVAGGSALLLPSPTKAEDTPPIVQQVENQGKQLQNHETRISGLESGTPVSISTGTTTTSTPVSTPDAVSSPSAAPAPVPAPPAVTVTGRKPVDGDNGSTDCLISYSDGHTELLPWKTVNPQGAWMIDEATQVGKWVESTQTSGTCN